MRGRVEVMIIVFGCLRFRGIFGFEVIFSVILRVFSCFSILVGICKDGWMGIVRRRSNSCVVGF